MVLSDFMHAAYFDQGLISRSVFVPVLNWSTTALD